MKFDGVGDFFADNGVKKNREEAEKLFNQIDAYPFFETIRVVRGVPLFKDEHFNRLIESLEFLRYHSVPTVEELSVNLFIAARELELDDINIKLMIVDDDYENRHIFAYPVQSRFPTERAYKEGVPCSLYVYDRRSNSKIYSDLDFEEIGRNTLKLGAFESLLMNSDAKIREGGRSNFFAILDGKILTAPEDEIIPTVNRKMVLEIINDLKLPILETPITVREMYNLSGAFIIGSTIGVLPLSRIEAISLESANNPMVKSILEEYNKRIDNIINI